MTRTVIAVLAGLAVLVAGLLVRPATPYPGPATGDQAVIDAVRAAGHPGHRTTVVLLDGDTTRVAHFDGAGPDTRYEVGSISKAMTGKLLAVGVERGELNLDDRLGDHLDVGDGPPADLTLRALATHSTGLPRLNTSLVDIPVNLWSSLAGTNPYRGTPEELFRDAADTSLGEPTFAYSNFGAALTGHAAAAAAGTGYPELARQRLFEPLGMTDTAVQSVEPLVEPGLDAAGRTQQPWVMDAMAPTGAVVSTPQDMTTWARALLAGTAPGMAALEPLAPTDGAGEQIGMFWFVTEPDGQVPGHVWHNGATGGYSSFVAVDRERQRAVVVLNATGDGATPLGRDLLADTDLWS